MKILFPKKEIFLRTTVACLGKFTVTCVAEKGRYIFASGVVFSEKLFFSVCCRVVVPCRDIVVCGGSRGGEGGGGGGERSRGSSTGVHITT